MRPIDANELLTAFPVDDEPTITKSCVRMTIKNMPTIEPEPQWIPCSERLPEPNEMVLISVNGEVDADWIAVDNTGYGCWYRTMKYAIDIDAWMPLPESYKEKKR